MPPKGSKKPPTVIKKDTEFAVPEKKKAPAAPAVVVDDVELDYGDDDPELGEENGEDSDDTSSIVTSTDSTINTKYIDKDPVEFNPPTHLKIVIVHPSNRITSEIMTRFEYAEVRGLRAAQIEKGAPLFVDRGELIDPMAIAEKEIRMKRCPLTIQRETSRITDCSIIEEWEVNEMSIPMSIEYINVWTGR